MKKAFVILLSVFITLNFALFTVSAEEINLSANSAILVNADTLEIFYSKNSKTKLPMASTTKIMTALLLAECPDLSKTITTTKEMVTVEGSSMGLKVGDTVSYRDLLYGMLLASGNDAANTTAIALAGSVEKFAQIMNSKAKSLGLTDTNFVTPSGLDDENHYTTAYDLARLTAYALKNAVFKEACSSEKATLFFGNPPYNRTLKNHNKLLSAYTGLIGVKTGFTKRSGRCLVTAAERDGVTFIAVTLNDPNDWDDHIKLLDFGFSSTKKIVFENTDIPDTLNVISGDAEAVKISIPRDEFSVFSKSEISRKVLLPSFVYSDLHAGEQVGEVRYYLKDALIKVSEIISLADIKLYNKNINLFTRIIDSFKLLLKFI